MPRCFSTFILYTLKALLVTKAILSKENLRKQLCHTIFEIYTNQE